MHCQIERMDDSGIFGILLGCQEFAFATSTKFGWALNNIYIHNNVKSF